MAQTRDVSVFEQNWLHARHVENERLWFTNVYAVVVAAALAFIANVRFPFTLFVIVFMLIFTLLGLVVVLKLGLEFTQHVSLARKMSEIWSLGELMGSPLQDKVRIKLSHLMSVWQAFVIFYAVSFGIFCALLTYVLWKNTALAITMFSIPALLLGVIAIWYGHTKGREITDQIKMVGTQQPFKGPSPYTITREKTDD